MVVYAHQKALFNLELDVVVCQMSELFISNQTFLLQMTTQTMAAQYQAYQECLARVAVSARVQQVAAHSPSHRPHSLSHTRQPCTIITS